MPSVRKQISRIRDLGYPPGDKAELDAVYTKTEKALDQIEKDPERYRTATSNPFADENKFLKSYGLTACGSRVEPRSRAHAESGGRDLRRTG